MIRRQVQGWPLRIGVVATCAILLVVAAVGQRPDIQTGGTFLTAADSEV